MAFYGRGIPLRKHSDESDSSDSSDSSFEQEHTNKAEAVPVWLGNLQNCLDAVESAGEFAVFDRHSVFANPDLHIRGDRFISLPLTPGDAEILKAASWEPYFMKIAQQAADRLGLLGVAVRPYKLLLYEKGSFFKRHKDSEKEAGMVGTLVISLPSQHEGGDVSLSFQTESKTFATSPGSSWDISALAWFSDVSHEIAEIKQGYRLVLTYNLVQNGPAVQTAESTYRQQEKVRTRLLRWKTQIQTPDPIVYPLDHQYTESSLSLANMKGRDRAVCNLLSNSAASCGLFLFFAQVTRSRTEECGYDEYEDSEVETMFKALFTLNGKEIGSNLTVSECQIMGTDINDREPDSEEEGEFTGNEGAPTTFHYHDTVAMLVRKEELVRLTQGDRSEMHAENLVALVNEDLQARRNEAMTQYASACLIDILTKRLRSPSVLQIALYWAMELNNSRLIVAALASPAVSYVGSGTNNKEAIQILAALVERAYTGTSEDIDWDRLLLPTLAERGEWSLLHQVLHIMYFGRIKEPYSGIVKATFEHLIEHCAWALILRGGALFLTPCPAQYYTYDFPTLLDHTLDIGAGGSATKLLETLCNRWGAELKKGGGFLTASQSITLLGTVVKVLQKHKVLNSPPAKRLLDIVIQYEIGRNIPECPKKLPGWAHKPRRCDQGQCQDCVALNRFLVSESEKVWRFTAVQARRKHVESALKQDYPLRFQLVTERVKSPQTLVVEKLEIEFSEEMKPYLSAIKNMRRHLAALEGDFVREMLSDERYRKLILLEDLDTDDSSEYVAAGKRQWNEAIGGIPKRRNLGGTT
ncbi:hypothetical protein CMQ_1418 [Grosmannia clavigera kw1407]|uniref:Uncharacterized protein n=1 Tax=Grosmannia clavigera (strain kw1407 / UAMH 11150) TaxID=655863 RepID=F0XEF5_GROCL|nr:uncharacterized protein CMQ_1418 [Grosmannia clavigera kw1407]EFX04490.1 hypothetical protein CMQ_1418 [Grosmannia clavigera kw1407]